MTLSDPILSIRSNAQFRERIHKRSLNMEVKGVKSRISVVLELGRGADISFGHTLPAKQSKYIQCFHDCPIMESPSTLILLSSSTKE